MFEQYVNPEARPDRTDSYTAGLRSYELKDHLGNVRVVVTDDRPATAANATAAYQYYAFGSPMPGRYGLANLVGQGGYRYGFNGKEKDDDLTKTTGATYDYGFRIYDARIAKFLSVDPLASKYPMLSTYQFASNSPISGIDLDGLEYYYAADGSLLRTNGTNTQVRIVNCAFVKQVNNLSINVLNKYSTDVGMTNEELNARAFMSTLKQAENGGREALPYNAWNGISRSGDPLTFTDDTFEESPEDYSTHPGKRSGGSAAGSYQIMQKTWNDKDIGAEAWGIDDFSPTSQDKFIFLTIKYKLKALKAVISGDTDEAINKTATEWRALPGPKSQSKLTREKVKKIFKQNVSNELNGKSNIATEKGKLTKYEKGKKRK